MSNRTFFAQNVMRSQGGGITERTPGWFLIENLVDVPNPSAYSLTITVGDNSGIGLRNIIPKVVYNPETRQWSANITDIQSSELYITRIKFGLFEVNCVTDWDTPIFPKEVLTDYGVHLQLTPYLGDKTNYRFNSVLHNMDCISCNGEVIGDFGICLYNGTELAPAINIWNLTNVGVPLDISVVHSLDICTNATLTNGKRGLSEGWFDPSVTDDYMAQIINQTSTGGSNVVMGGWQAPDHIDIANLYDNWGMDNPRDNYVIRWSLVNSQNVSGNSSILTIHPHWLNSNLDYYMGIVRQLNK